MSVPRGAVACGHPVTLKAALSVLEAGGNAFDAAAAALWTACVAEPLLAAPGGGGFLVARTGGGRDRVYDFFAQTPFLRRPPHEEDFREILADFGTVQQAFHIGLGSAATPGLVAGAFAFHRDLGRMPAEAVFQPAIRAARDGVLVNAMQAYLARILHPIIHDTEGARALYAPGGRVVKEGDLHRLPELADFLEALAAEGADLFYRGVVAERVDEASRQGGGHLRREDFSRYRLVVRRPLRVEWRGHTILTNPPPASGGLLVGFGLQALEQAGALDDTDPSAYALAVADALAAMHHARMGEGLDEGLDPAVAERVLTPEIVSRYLEVLRRHPPADRGTTQVSVVDGDGNAASLTISNGEGCGWAVPGCGFMLNNMLGEADLQPRGFGRWPPDTRLTSMMAPTLVKERASDRIVALGSGGSNRIRSAILQCVVAMVGQGLPLREAVGRPRLHVEGRRLEIEGGFPNAVVAALERRWSDRVEWPDTNLFFGGVHAVESGSGGMAGCGDPRRGGVASVLGADEG